MEVDIGLPSVDLTSNQLEFDSRCRSSISDQPLGRLRIDKSNVDLVYMAEDPGTQIDRDRLIAWLFLVEARRPNPGQTRKHPVYLHSLTSVILSIYCCISSIAASSQSSVIQTFLLVWKLIRGNFLPKAWRLLPKVNLRTSLISTTAISCTN